MLYGICGSCGCRWCPSIWRYYNHGFVTCIWNQGESCKGFRDILDWDVCRFYRCYGNWCYTLRPGRSNFLSSFPDLMLCPACTRIDSEPKRYGKIDSGMLWLIYRVWWFVLEISLSGWASVSSRIDVHYWSRLRVAYFRMLIEVVFVLDSLKTFTFKKEKQCAEAALHHNNWDRRQRSSGSSTLEHNRWRDR